MGKAQSLSLSLSQHHRVSPNGPFYPYVFSFQPFQRLIDIKKCSHASKSGPIKNGARREKGCSHSNETKKRLT